MRADQVPVIHHSHGRCRANGARLMYAGSFGPSARTLCVVARAALLSARLVRPMFREDAPPNARGSTPQTLPIRNWPLLTMVLRYGRSSLQEHNAKPAIPQAWITGFMKRMFVRSRFARSAPTEEAH
jgi:hypothetical protein